MSTKHECGVWGSMESMTTAAGDVHVNLRETSRSSVAVRPQSAGSGMCQARQEWDGIDEKAARLFLSARLNAS